MFKFKSVAAAVILTCAASYASVNAAGVSVDYLGIGSADIDGTAGSLKTSSVGIKADWNFLSFEARNTKYDFSGLEDDPFDDLKKLQLTLHHVGSISSNITYLAAISFGTLYEGSVSFGDSYNIIPFFAAGWNFRNGMSLFFGATANLNKADNEFLPVLGLKIGDDADRGWSGSIAYPETKIQYRFSPSLATNASLLYISDIYHLDDDVNRKGDLADGYFREKSYGTTLNVVLTPIQHLELTAGVAAVFNRKFEIYNKDGNKIDSFDTDPSFGGYVKAKYVF